MQFCYKGINLFAFSDTHGFHNTLHIPADTDILICAGDAVEDNLNPEDYHDFIDWFTKQPGKLKVFVPGNHELIFDLAPLWGMTLFENTGIILGMNTHLSYGDLTIYLLAGPSIPREHLELVKQADILVSHYQPEMFLDEEIACPHYHIFGHEHTLGGQRWEVNKKIKCNVSKYNELIQNQTTPL